MGLFLIERRRSGLQAFLWFGLLAGGLLAGASVTFRQEFRWLYAPYVVALLFWAYAAVRTPRRAMARVAFAALVASSVVNDAYLRSHRGNL